MRALETRRLLRSAWSDGLDEAEALATAELFKALGDPARVRIVNLLATSVDPVCACETVSSRSLFPSPPSPII